MKTLKHDFIDKKYSVDFPFNSSVNRVKFVEFYRLILILALEDALA